MRRNVGIFGMAIIGGLILGCENGGRYRTASALPGAGDDRGFPEWALGLFAPLPRSDAGPTDRPAVALGRALYFETLLSKGRNVSCNSCHPLDRWGTTGRPNGSGDPANLATLDVPSVYNAAAEVDLFWDGRAHNVEEQARGSIVNPLEMGMVDETALVERMRAMARYREMFRAVDPAAAEPVTLRNAAAALAAFERRLVTESRWDKFLRGDRNALTAEEKTGFATFVAKGCSDCHNGVAVGGRMYQMVGQVKPWPLQSDSGLYATSRKQEDLFVFRVPQLRNIEKTGPYFDTGVVNDLSEAVRLMARYQRGINLSDREVASIVAWLGTLTGTLPAEEATTVAASGRAVLR